MIPWSVSIASSGVMLRSLGLVRDFFAARYYLGGDEFHVGEKRH